MQLCIICLKCALREADIGNANASGENLITCHAHTTLELKVSHTHTHTSISWKMHVWLPLRRRILNVTQANGRTSMWQALPVCVWQVLPVAQQIMQILDVCVQIAPNCKRIKSVTYFVAEIYSKEAHRNYSINIVNIRL